MRAIAGYISLAGEARATFISYPMLPHIFMATDKMSQPADYQVVAEADGQIARDIVNFITAQKEADGHMQLGICPFVYLR